MTQSDSSSKTEKAIPKQLGRYQVLGQLGAGGMGHVYRVYDPVNDREIALKELKFDYPRALHYFKREFRAVASLSHPNLVNLHDLYHDDGRYFYTMELVEGRDIYFFVNQHNRIVRDPAILCEPERLKRVFKCFTQLLLALDYLHSHGCIHRDIKPANILVDHRDNLRLVDFGVVKEEIPGGEGQSLSQVFGTSTYFSPEQSLSSRVTSATDIYASGVVLYELLVGVTPFSGTQEELSEKHRNTPPKPILEQVPQTHEMLAWVCHEMLAKEPSRRPSAREILEFLKVPPVEVNVKKSVEFIGRNTERDILHSALDEVTEGRGRMILIEGEEGVGKSSCVEAFTQEARLFGASCFLGACVDRDHVSYRGIDTVIERLAEAYRSLIAKIMRHHIPSRERYGLIEGFSFLGELLPSEMHQNDKNDVHSGPALGLFGLLKNLSKERTLVLIVEHIHLADAEALDLFESLQAGGELPPVLLILTYSPEQVRSNSRVSSFLEYATSQPSTMLVRLNPLSRPEVREMVQFHLSRSEPELVEYIYHQTGGLPGFVIEMINAIKTQGHGETFQEIIIRKINNLNRSARRILAVVCLSTSSVPESVLEHACELTPDEVYEGLVGLTTEGLVREVIDAQGRVDVIGAHPRLMEVARACVSQERAPMIHQRIARALEQTNGSARQLERHWSLAGSPANATQFALHAAHLARVHEDHKRAVEMYRLSLKGQLNADMLVNIRVNMADSLARSGRYLEAAQTLEALSELSMPEATRWRARRYQLYLMSGEVNDLLSQADKLSDKAKMILADLLLPLRPLMARSLLGDQDSLTARLVKVSFLAGTHNERAVLEAERILEQLDIDPERIAYVVAWGLARVNLLGARGAWTRAHALLDELQERARGEEVFTLNQLRILEWRARTALQLCNIHESKAMARQLLVTARSHGLLGLRATGCMLMANAHIEAGEDAAATRLIAESTRSRKPQPQTLAHVELQLTSCRQLLYQGHIVETLVNLRALRRTKELQPFLTRRSTSLEFSLLHGRAAAMLALIDHYQMDVDRGPLTGSLALPTLELLEQACEILERAIPRPKAWLSFFRAVICLIKGDTTQLNSSTIQALQSEEEEFKQPLIRSIFGALYLLALRRAEEMKLGDARNTIPPQENKFAQRSARLRSQLAVQQRRAGISSAPEIKIIEQLR